MTINKAIELIKKDVEFYKRQITTVDTFRDKFFKNNNLDDAPHDSMRSIIKETRQSLHEMLISLYESQIKYYESIIVELEPKKKLKN